MLRHVPVEQIFLWISILLIISLGASKLSGKIGIPALLLFLGIGMLAGSDGFGGIYFNNPYIAQLIGVAALIFILFSGAINTNWNNVKKVYLSGTSLSTIGVFVTALLVSVFVYYLLNLSFIESLLLGAIVSSTDAAAVFSVLRSNKTNIDENLQTVIELESASNDPMAVLFTISLIRILTVANTTYLDLLQIIFTQISIGLILGWIMGSISPWIINKIKLEQDGLYSVLVISLVLFTYSITTTMNGNGFLAVYLTGLLMGRVRFNHKKKLIHFSDSITWLMQIAMFLVLGLLVFPSQLVGVIWIDIIIAFFLIIVARPISVFISLMFSQFNMREKLMISWVGLRGAVPIILATFPLIADVPNAKGIFNLVFFIVITSVLIQGTLISFMAHILKLKK
tara:strand:+ start:4139 stop:5329 length:1191 start_codon:yes stop_codon:yes gene_type:complete